MATRNWLDHMRKTYGLPLVALVGLGYWVQGFRVFPWLGVNYYLKDNLKVDPAMLQFLQQTANLPFLAKPIYGLVSDAVYVRGAHRVPYLVLAGLLQVLSWGTIVFHPTASTSVGILTVYLILSNFGVAIGEVANDAIIAEFGKKKGSATGELQSFAWLAASTGALLGNLVAGLALNRVETTSIFALFLMVAACNLIACSLVDEKALAQPEEAFSEIQSKAKVDGVEKDDGNAKDHGPKHRNVGVAGVKDQLVVLTSLLKRPEIVRPIVWFTFSIAVIPSLLGSLFYYQTEVLKVDSFYLGLSKTVGQIGVLLGSIVYNKYLKDMPLRKQAAGMQTLLALTMLFDIALVKGLNTRLGVSDEAYVVAFSGLMEALGQFKLLPVMVLLAKLCPPGTEGSLLAIFSSCVCLANILSGYFGVALASLLQISSDNFSRLAVGIVIEAALALSPVFFTSLLPGDEEKVRSS